MKVLHAMPRWFAAALLGMAATSVASRATAVQPREDASHAAEAAQLDESDGGFAGDGPANTDPGVARLRQRTAQIANLLEGRLAVEIAPASLFEVAIADDSATEIEAARLRAMLRDLDSNRQSAAKGVSTGRAGQPPYSRDGGGDGGMRTTALWTARIELDRMTLQFLELPKARREELLGAHAERQRDAERERAEMSAKEGSLQETGIERRKVLEDARRARAEAEHLVAKEYNRLLGVRKAQAEYESSLAERRQSLAERRNILAGWRRRAADAPEQQPFSTASADTTYDDLRTTLRSARAEFAAALDDAGAPSVVPAAGEDPLARLAVDVDASNAREVRKEVESEAQRLRAEERGIREQRVAELFDEIETLNDQRLALQPFLSPQKRAAITGLGAVGFDQAASEMRQLALILRYHRHVTSNWIASLRRPGQSFGMMAARGTIVLFEWMLVLGVFVTWRRHAPVVLERLLTRAVQGDRDARRADPSFSVQAIRFLQQVRKPLEWLALLAALGWFLPPEAMRLIEVQLVFVVLRWSLIGALVVVALNAIAGAASHHVLRSATTDASVLRFRSLKLVGRVVVALGLVLVISARLVGKGTLYQWVWSSCWFASIPVLVLLVHWWREVVFLRLQVVHRNSTFERWVLAHRAGWKSFPAAAAGAVYLSVRGSWRGVRSWVGRFDVTRRVLAYLFRRELNKLVEEQPQVEFQPLSDSVFSALGPEQLSDESVATSVDDRLDALVTRLQHRQGGLVALVGERGMGKTHSLRRLRERVPEVTCVDLGSFDAGDLHGALVEQLGLTERGLLTAFSEHREHLESYAGILVDGAERLVRPAMGGLAAFDKTIGVARRNSSQLTWVLAFDEVVWQYLERARGARPIFDDVIHLERWREEEIAELLRLRSARAGIRAKFDLLLDRLPRNADDFDRREALARREASYYRLVWDHAGENPGVALHAWRRSLGKGSGGEVYVRFLQRLDVRDLEALPDAAVFVLRAVLQLSPALPSAVCEATLLREAQVADALRYAKSRGYVTEKDGRLVIDWTWFRPIVRFLQRRHLLLAH